MAFTDLKICNFIHLYIYNKKKKTSIVAIKCVHYIISLYSVFIKKKLQEWITFDL